MAAKKFAEESRPILDSVLAALDGLKLKKASIEMGGAKVPPSNFNRAVYMSVQDEMINVQTGDLVFLGRDTLDLGPIHHRAISDAPFGISGPGYNYDFCLNSVDTVTQREARGHVLRPMSRMVRIATAFVRSNGAGTTIERYCGIDSSGNAIDISNSGVGGVPTGYADTEDSEAVWAAAGIELWLRYSWTVEIGSIGSNFKIRVPTSPEGARALLALRDVEAGMKRRRALRHWVTAHNRRRTKEEAEADVPVRAHLRGATPFQWEDLEGVVRPSAFDLESNGGA